METAADDADSEQKKAACHVVTCKLLNAADLAVAATLLTSLWIVLVGCKRSTGVAE